MENKQGVPSELQHSLFFEDNDWKDHFTKENLRKPFFYEVMAYRSKCFNTPWDAPEQFITEYLEQWDKIENHIRVLFSSRKREEASSEMVYQIGYFIEAIYWMNGKKAQPALLSDNVDSLDYVPVNTRERIEFVIENYNHHTSFVQLRQLIIELRKKWAIIAIQKSQSER